MPDLVNRTPFTLFMGFWPDLTGRQALHVLCKATFTLHPGLRVAESQAPIAFADQYSGEPGLSGLVYATEAHSPKPGTDVVLLGSAQAPGRRRIDRIDVDLMVAGRRKVVRVSGDRQWTGGVLPPLMSAPQPFETLPLVWERAFGGTVETDTGGPPLSEPRNPVGCGLFPAKGRKEIRGKALPNLEDPARVLTEPGQRAAPAGFGFVAPTWEPRRSKAGTYDEEGMKERAPLLPRDFDPGFLNAAPAEFVFREALRGGEPVELHGASERGPLRFAVPECELRAGAGTDEGRVALTPALQTVLIEPDANRLCLTWCAVLPCEKGVDRVEEVEVSLERIKNAA